VDIGPPPSPFGVSWESLTLAHVRAFLAKGPPERAAWEAKSQGTKGQLAGFVRKEVCGFANRHGGYLLLGAQERRDDGWELPGLRLARVRELHDWIASLLRELEPTPLPTCRATSGGVSTSSPGIKPRNLRAASWTARPTRSTAPRCERTQRRSSSENVK
jgi:hypothetical protein